MKNFVSTNLKLGILGGGQLGKMFLAQTQKFDIYTSVLDGSNSAPCKAISNEFHQGDLLDFDTVYSFGKAVDLLTIEIENVNIDALLKLEQEGLEIYPSPQTLQKIQSKAVQKQFYVDNNIPTAPFQRFDNLKALEANENTFPFIWKSARFGYDGTGVKVVRSVSDLDNLPNVECIAEELVNFKTELAVIVARNTKGESKTYPVVEMEFHPEANQVEYVLCPARIPKQIKEKAQAVAQQVSKAYNHVGLLAVELFLTQDDQILVNEVAPRPHNSGHYSIEASYTCQFEQHLRCILGLPLGDTSSKVAGVMVNLVGAEGHQGDVEYQGIEQILDLKGVTPHIYGKKQTRPFRKMGHVTIVDNDIAVARHTAEKVKQTIKVIAK